MKTFSRRTAIRMVASAIGSSAILGGSVRATSYPSKSVRVVIPAAAGGATSIMARILTDHLQAAMGEPFVADYKGGGAGLIGVDAVAKAPHDGYTLLLTYGGPVGSGLALFKSMPFDPFRDLTPIARVAEVQLVLVTSPNFKGYSLSRLIEYARSNPDKLTAAINSYGSMGHLLTEQFRLDNNIKITPIPYKGSSQALPDLAGGSVDICIDPIPSMQGLIKGGRVFPIAVSGSKRSELLPDVPTFTELGVPNMLATTWYALYAPAGTSQEIVQALATETEKILANADVKDLMVKAGGVVNFAPPAQLAAFMREEADKWGRIAKTAGMQPE